MPHLLGVIENAVGCDEYIISKRWLWVQALRKSIADNKKELSLENSLLCFIPTRMRSGAELDGFDRSPEFCQLRSCLVFFRLHGNPLNVCRSGWPA